MKSEDFKAEDFQEQQVPSSTSSLHRQLWHAEKHQEEKQLTCNFSYKKTHLNLHNITGQNSSF